MSADKNTKRGLMVAAVLGSLVLMAALDYVTGQELVFSCAYLVPVGLCAWSFPRRWVIATAALAGVTALLVDHFDGYSYSHPIIQYFNALTCFVISLATGLLLSRLRQTFIERERAIGKLRSTLAQLEASTAEIRKLQEGLQTVCAWTNKIQVGEEWMTPDEFLTKHLHLNITHGMSPEAFREMAKDISAAA